MTSTRSRLGVLGSLFAGGFAVVMLHLWGVMVADHPVWARRSHENRWAFRLVPTVRGAIRDRTGAVLAHDEPTMELSLYYKRFRLWHAVGAAVHGATVWARLQPGSEETTYSYEGNVLGPEQAARDLLAIPVAAMRPGAYPKDVTAELSTLATTVLAACSGLPRKQVFAAMRQAALQGRGATLGDVVPGLDAADLLDRHRRLLDELRRFEAQLQDERAVRYAQRGRPVDDTPILFPKLEGLRRSSLAGERVERVGPDGKPLLDEDGKPKLGDLKETIAWPFADHVPFELAATLRVGARSHPGLEVNPSVQRVVAVPDGSSVRALLGLVYDVDHTVGAEAWTEEYLERELPDQWLDEIVPAEATANEADRQRMKEEARSSFQRALLVHERRGVAAGIEAGFDAELAGRLGMRLVERDARRREQQLWSDLRVQSGDDVALTLDLGLQHIAERIVRQEWERMAARHTDPDDAAFCEAGVAVIDARSGDVLAVAGAPVAGRGPRDVPGMSWRRNGSVGSVVKPFVLLEQLQAQALGRPHRAVDEFRPCVRDYDYRGHRLRCDSAHGADGCDAVLALAKSCNSYFYQCAEGLGEDGVQRALGRFGLHRPPGGASYEACWQEPVRGLPFVAPQWTGKPYLPRRAIGYEVHASPLSIARAYAGLATGRLPSLGLRLGEVRPGVPLVGFEHELEVVRAGLRECVLSGTARKVDSLAEFAVFGKTGTAQVGDEGRENNAWFAGFLPEASASGMQLSFCAVIYWVPDGVHGAEAAGGLVGRLLQAVRDDPELGARYLPPGGGR